MTALSPNKPILTLAKGKGNTSRKLHTRFLLRNNVANILRRDLLLPRPGSQHRVQTPNTSDDKKYIVLHGADKALDLSFLHWWCC